MAIDISVYEAACENYLAAQAQLESAKEMMEDGRFNIKKKLINGEKTFDRIMDMCVFEYKEDFMWQFNRMDDLEMLLREHEGQLVQIVENHKPYDGERDYKESSIGIIGENPLSVRENKERKSPLSEMPRYSLLFNFDGEHIFYREGYLRSPRHGCLIFIQLNLN